MIMRFATVLATAATALALSIPAKAQTATAGPQLVSANTELTHALDAKNVKQGDAVTAKLRGNVRLGDGTTLGRGTDLLGHIDKITGTSEIVLTFDKAQLKGGKQVPIKATITAIIPAGTPDYRPDTPFAGMKINSVGGPVNLNSATDSSNSGLLSSKKDLRLSNGTQLEFALSAAAAASNTAVGN